MAGHQAGWIKLHRIAMDGPIWQNKNLWRVFSWCMMKASHKKHVQMVGLTKVELDPGQFIFGRDAASRETGLPPSTVWTSMQWLKSNNTIDIKSDNKKSVVTLVNWALYQSCDDESDSKTNGKSNRCRTATGHKQEDLLSEDLKNVKAPLDQALDDFAEHRRKLKKPLTDRARKLLLAELDKLASTDDEKIAIIDQAILSGWLKFFPLKSQGKPIESKPIGNNGVFSYANSNRPLFEEQQ